MISLIEQSLDKSFTYSEYRNHLSQLLQQGLTSGDTQSEERVHFSTLNEVRMNRLDKTMQLPMTYKQPGTNDFFPAWVEYYNELGKPIPEGLPGCNPGGMSVSDKIEIVGIY